MNDGQWFLVTSSDPQRPWTGRIWSEGDGRSRWRFEVIRQTDVRDMYESDPFEAKGHVTGLLDHQRPCTLIHPNVRHIAPGTFGADYHGLRTTLSGGAQALLTGIQVPDGDEPLFAGIGFESDAFAAWFGGQSFSRRDGEDYRIRHIEAKDPHKEQLEFEGVGRIEVERVASVKDDYRSSAIQTRTIIRLHFSKPRSLHEAIDHCIGLEALFGFLAGYRPRPPLFHLWKPKGEGGEDYPNRTGVLEIGGLRWTDREFPHVVERLHICGQNGVGLAEVLSAFFPAMGEFVARIHAIESSRYFAETVNDKFARTMPVFDRYLQQTYTAPDEESFVAQSKAFFDWVKAADDPDIAAFAHKHIVITDKKSPSLQTLVRRAIDRMNREGFDFPAGLAKRIVRRRGAMFHSGEVADKIDVLRFATETRAITALLMFHVLDDLGVAVAPLAEKYHPLRDFAFFLKKSTANPAEPE